MLLSSGHARLDQLGQASLSLFLRMWDAPLRIATTKSDSLHWGWWPSCNVATVRRLVNQALTRTYEAVILGRFELVAMHVAY